MRREAHELRIKAIKTEHAYSNASDDYMGAMGTPRERVLKLKTQELELALAEAEFAADEAEQRLSDAEDAALGTTKDEER